MAKFPEFGAFQIEHCNLELFIGVAWLDPSLHDKSYLRSQGEKNPIASLLH